MLSCFLSNQKEEVKGTSGCLCSGTFELKQNSICHLISCFALKILLAFNYLFQEPLSSQENVGILKRFLFSFSSSFKKYVAERGSVHGIVHVFLCGSQVCHGQCGK